MIIGGHLCDYRCTRIGLLILKFGMAVDIFLLSFHYPSYTHGARGVQNGSSKLIGKVGRLMEWYTVY